MKESIMKKSILVLIFIAKALICSAQQIPEYFGVYIVENGKLIQLKENKILIKTPNKGGMQEDCVAGLKRLSNVNVNDESAYLIIFLENFDINSIRLSKLRFSKMEPLVSIPIIGDAVKIQTDVSMWIFEKDISFRTGPIEGKRGMYKIVPTAGFEPGVFALHQGGIRRSRIQGGQLGVLLENEEYGNSAFDFSFKAKDKDAISGTETPIAQKSLMPLAGTYIYKYNKRSYIEFRSDGTFIGQVITSKGTINIRGTYEYDGENIIVIGIDGKTDRGKLEGDTYTDGDGIKWIKKRGSLPFGLGN